ncbi:unnamed protein product, partial [Phaeothamnion confervicola]
SRYIQEHTTPEDTIFVFRGGAITYFLSDRRAPTKYFQWVLHDGDLGRIVDSKGIPFQEIQEHPPALVVDVIPRGAGSTPAPGYLYAYFMKGYRLAKTIKRLDVI